jgi:hypothetical protein
VARPSEDASQSIESTTEQVLLTTGASR